MQQAVNMHQAPEMAAAEFARWQKLIEVRTGIHLPTQRQSFLQQALMSRMREIGVNDFNAYFVSLRDGAQAALEWAILVDLLTVHETRFFRHPESFDLVRSYCRNRLQQDEHLQSRSLQLWSVGCSSGEEVYSLAILLQELQQEQGSFYFGVTGTDISYPALASAREGIYHLRRLIGISDEQRATFFKALGDDYYQVISNVRQRTCFVQGNIHELRMAKQQMFDVIYCQNVMIYFQNEKRRELLNNLVAHLRPGGMLVLAPGEVLRWQHPHLSRIENKHCLAYSHRGEDRVAE